jgi:hypothetical protein
LNYQCENWRSIGMGTHGWLIKVGFPWMVPTLDGWVPLDRADVAEVGFAFGQPGGGQGGQAESPDWQIVQ